MKKAPVLITLSVIVAIGATAYFISQKSERKELDLWDLVPSQALAVLEGEQFEILQRLKLDSAALLENLAPQTSGISSLCVFQTLGSRIDFLVLQKEPAKTEWATWIKQIQTSSGATVKTRRYESYEIQDLLKGNLKWLSVAKVENVWIIGTNSVLVEEIIRQRRAEKKISFKGAHASLFKLSSIRRDDGNLYVNWKKLSHFISRAKKSEVQYLQWLCHSMLFDIRRTGNALMLNGFATDSAGESSTLLSLFKEQQPVSFDLKSVIPDQYQEMVHVGVSDPATMLKKRMKFANAHKVDLQSYFNELNEKHSFSFDEFVKGIDNELAFCLLEQEEIAFVELKEITKTVAALTKLNNSAAKAGLYMEERYSSQLIHQIKLPDLAYHLFWPWCSRSPESFYAIIGNHLIYSDKESGIKKVIDLMEAESTIGKSLHWRKFFESGLQESNISFFVNTRQIETADPNHPLLTLGRVNDLEDFSLQFYALEGNYYAHATILFGESGNKPASPRKTTGAELELDQIITSSPWLVRNHTDRSTDILVQDSAHYIYLLSRKGKIQWKLNVNGSIQGEVAQIDFLKNNKLQYLFMTDGQLHLVDRLGRYVTGFPRKLSIEEPRYLSVVDYDKSKNYRFLIADSKGKIYVYDQSGALLDGWNPKRVDRRLSASPQHWRVRQKDFYVALTDNGSIHLFSRNGAKVSGSPFRLDFRPVDFFLRENHMLFISHSGQIVKIDSQGKITDDKFFPKNTTAATFTPAISPEGKIVIARKDRGNLAVFDVDEKQIFEIVNPLSENIVLNYLSPAKGKDVFLLFDQEQNLFFAVDGKGKMLTPRPLPATKMPSAIWDTELKQLTFFVPDQQKLKLISVPV